MKIIDILNKIARKELPHKTKFKVYSSCRDKDNKEFVCEYDENYPGIIWCITDNTKFNYKIDYMRILNYEVELIEQNKEIEEMPTKLINTSDPIEHIVEQHNKINELVRAVNKLIKEREEK